MYIELTRPVEKEDEMGIEKEVEAEEEEDSKLRREDDEKAHDQEHDEEQEDCDFCSNNCWKEPRTEEVFGSVEDLFASLN